MGYMTTLKAYLSKRRRGKGKVDKEGAVSVNMDVSSAVRELVDRKRPNTSLKIGRVPDTYRNEENPGSGEKTLPVSFTSLSAESPLSKAVEVKKKMWRQDTKGLVQKNSR